MSKRIMVVDDSRIVQLQMQKVLADSQYEVAVCCKNGQEAIEKYETEKPDLITMDILMPGIDGLEAARQIIEKHPDAKILMVSSLAYDDTMQEAHKISANGFIYMTVDSDQFLTRLEDIFAENE